MTVTKPIEDYAIWLYLRDTHCAFLRKRKNLRICTNDYTLNSTHSYVFCPLIAENYITVKLEGTTVIAFKKNPGVRIPSQMWEHIELPQTKEEGMQALKAYAKQMALHSALQEELLTRGDQLFDIAEELRLAPTLDEDLKDEELDELDEDLKDEELDELDEDLKDEELDEFEEDLLDEELDELDEDLLDEEP